VEESFALDSGALTMQIHLTPTGHIRGEAKVVDFPPDGASLRIPIHADQTYLPLRMTAIDSALETVEGWYQGAEQTASGQDDPSASCSVPKAMKGGKPRELTWIQFRIEAQEGIVQGIVTRESDGWARALADEHGRIFYHAGNYAGGIQATPGLAMTALLPDLHRVMVWEPHTSVRIE
jgi:hypothetical protein